MLRGTTERTITQPAPAPVALEPKHEPLTLIVHVGGALVCALLFWVSWQGVAWALDAMGERNGFWRPLGGVLAAGAVVCGTGWGGWRLWHSFIAEIEDVRQRRRDWHEQMLDERRNAGGLIVDHEVTEWTLQATNLRDILLVALYVHWQVQRGVDRPWSVRKLSDTLYLGDSRHGRLIGELTQSEAEKMGAIMAQVGLIRGRSEKTAGQWNAESADDVLDRIVKGVR